MTSPILVMGHKNPDNDSISSAISYAYLKNELARRSGAEANYVPVRLGPMPPESAWIVETYGLETPQVINHVHARVSDVMSRNPISITCDASLLQAGRTLRQHNVRALVVNDLDGKYMGLITTRMMAERYVSSTDVLDDVENPSQADAVKAVADDLIASLYQKCEELIETDVLTLHEDDLLNEAVEDLMMSALREAVVLDDEGYCIGIITRSDVAQTPKRKVVLVDHNESRQAANGIDEAEVVEVIDHHRIADISTSMPIRFINLPVGSTASIITQEFRNLGIEIPRGIAAALLSAVMTDTVILKSPTATPFDHDQVAYLSNILDEDPTEFGLRVFRCRGGEETMPIEKLVGADAKEFQFGDSTVLIAQYETVTLDAVLEREDEIRAHMKKLVEANGYEFALLMVTDIMAEGSQFISEGNKRIVERVFDISCENGSTWMPGILSRKKQVAARILGA